MSEANPFVETAEPVENVEFSEEAEDSAEDWEEPEEPKKVAKKEKVAPEVKDGDDDLDAIIDEWSDD